MKILLRSLENCILAIRVWGKIVSKSPFYSKASSSFIFRKIEIHFSNAMAAEKRIRASSEKSHFLYKICENAATSSLNLIFVSQIL